MSSRITTQDIAEALGVSRNTVSKAINNTGILADSTREKILKKAMEMGYKQFSYINPADIRSLGSSAPQPQKNQGISVFTSGIIDISHFSSTMLNILQKRLAQLGYDLSVYYVREIELDSLKLPILFNQERAAGIICLELYDYAYSQMLCSLNLPILFIDSPVVGLQPKLRADILLMDNQTTMFRFIKEMADRGKSRLGFIGDSMQCQSFHERYMAFRNGLHMAGLPYIEKYCLTDNKEGRNHYSSKNYVDYLTARLCGLDELPEVFICANDFIAIDVLNILKSYGISVPDDIWLSGFDDSPESQVLSPSLTTVHIHTRIMAFSAIHLLTSRIKEHSLLFQTIHTETELIYRESTGDPRKPPEASMPELS